MKINQHHISKVFIHLLFWALFVFVSLFVFSNYYWKENPFLQYFFILLAIVYINNGILLPYFVKHKWYFSYALSIGLIAFLGTQAYCNYFAECGCSIMKCLSDYLWQTLVPIVFFSFLWMLYSYLEKQDEIEIIKKQHVEMELQLLKSQINPHVLFNNLNTVYAYALEKPNEVADLILKLSDNLKHVLYESTANKIALEKELDYIENYIAFQKIRTENLKTIVYNKDIESTNYEIAPLLLITLIENAFKHSSVKSVINIVIKVKNDSLYCCCENEYTTKLQDEIRPKIGLENLTKRLALLYKNKYEMKVEQNKGYKVSLRIDLK